MLPDYNVKYADCPNPVVSVKMGLNETYAFVEFASEELVHTAIKCSGVQVLGRPLHIGRPTGFMGDEGPPDAGLDVGPLKEKGILPDRQVDSKLLNMVEEEAKKHRTLYIGNLAQGLAVESVMHEVLGPAVQKLAEYDAGMGPPILRVHAGNAGNFCFIEFQSEALATSVLRTFNGMELLGSCIRVGLAKPKNSFQPPAPTPQPPQTRFTGTGVGFGQV